MFGFLLGELLAFRTKNRRFAFEVEDAEIAARALAFAGGRVLFDVEHIDGHQGRHRLEGTARTDNGAEIGRLQTRVREVPGGPAARGDVMDEKHAGPESDHSPTRPS